MGDVIQSRAYQAQELRREFMSLVSSCNHELAGEILSPYTVTLGDEFQGVARSLQSAVAAVLHLEETALQRGLTFKIRYVTLFGGIDTPINRQRAHTMLGPGLTQAREILTDKRRGRPRFRFVLPHRYTMGQLNRLWLALDGLMSR